MEVKHPGSEADLDLIVTQHLESVRRAADTRVWQHRAQAPVACQLGDHDWKDAYTSPLLFLRWCRECGFVPGCTGDPSPRLHARPRVPVVPPTRLKALRLWLGV